MGIVKIFFSYLKQQNFVGDIAAHILKEVVTGNESALQESNVSNTSTPTEEGRRYQCWTSQRSWDEGGPEETSRMSRIILSPNERLFAQGVTHCRSMSMIMGVIMESSSAQTT